VMGGASTLTAFTPSTNGQGGVIGAADLGYNITQNIAVEGGWFYIPQVSGNATGNLGSTSGTSAEINSWFAYMAAKLSVPVMQDLDLFGKVGVAYRSLSYNMPSGTSTALQNVTGDGNYWSPVFGTGLQYFFGDWSVGAQYTYLPGNTNVNYGNNTYGAPDAAPEINMYTAFLGYKFNV
jgi:hypothetical protein